MFGFAFDASCRIWRTDSCLSGAEPKKMSCELYDTRITAYAILGIAIVVKITQIITMLSAAYVYQFLQCRGQKGLF